MPINDTDVTAYMTELADAAGIAEDARPAFLANEKVKASARKRFEDVEREKGRTAAVELQRKSDYDKNMEIYQKNLQAVTDATTQVQAYEDRYGKLDAVTRAAAVTQATQDIIDKKTLDERIGATENNTVGLVTTAIKLLDKHRRDFPNEPFDVDAIVKTATENKLTAQQAYDVVMGPKVQAAQHEKIEADKKAAIDAALLEDRSKRAASSTIDAAPRSEFMQNLKKQEAPQTAKESFLQGWREPDPSATMQKEFGRKH